MSKNNKYIYQIHVDKFASEGKCLIVHEGKVGLVPKVAPGDIIDVRIIKDYKNYFEAIPIKIHKSSSYRVQPICQHYNICGGCKWQHIDYKHQLKAKKAQVEDAFLKILHLKNCIPEVIPSKKIFYYRNKLEYSFTNKRWIYEDEKNINIDMRALGYHIPGRFDKIFHVDECHLMDLYHNEVRNKIFEFSIADNIPFYNKKTHEGTLRSLIFRNNRVGDWMVIIVISEFTKKVENLFNKLIDFFPNISWNYAISNKLNDSIDGLMAVNLHGKSYLSEILDSFTFHISPFSFFQINPEQSENIYKKMIEISDMNSDDVAWDLYCGTGPISLYAANIAKNVIGIESNAEAVQLANKNAKINSIKNVKFIKGDVSKILENTHIDKPNIIFLDPPRCGLSKDVINIIKNLKPRTIIYLSCNAATQARDISLFIDDYTINFIQPYDMFPQTAHVENLVKLTVKNQ